ncbi:MAG: T9SS C-terminal target domain-containing protein [Calditrichaeota bacterium]|nr:MAG: T9SS C-terminal target domain-containing protein [Calditrichota bacterium]
MKILTKQILPFLSFFMLSTPASASNISGFIQGTLSIQNSPYTVTADLKIAVGDTLLIESGVVLQFNTSIGLINYGFLQAVGTEEDSIRFTSSSASPHEGDWSGIYFSTGSDGRLEFCQINYAGVALTLDAASPEINSSHFTKNNTGLDCLAGAAGNITESLFEKNPNAGIRILNAGPVVKRCILRQNSENGLESAIVLQGASGTIVQNFIFENINSGIDLTNSSAVKIYQNTIVQNDMGITISDCDPTIINNIIALNGTGISTENSIPAAFHNAVSLNSSGNFITPPAGLGVNTRRNTRGDSCDAYFNIQLDPNFFNPNSQDFRIQIGSPCIDTGDPTNPAEIWIAGAAPDMGANENNGVIVPVELVSLSISPNYLYWATASESNNLGFYIEMADKESGPFSSIGFVEGAGTTVERREYSFAINWGTGQRFYRLKQVDFDGSFEYSRVLKSENKSATVALAQNFPNPFSSNTTTTIQFNLLETGHVNLKIYDILARQVKTLIDMPVESGQISIQWDGRDDSGHVLSPGVYFYILSSPNGKLCKSLTLLN